MKKSLRECQKCFVKGVLKEEKKECGLACVKTFNGNFDLFLKDLRERSLIILVCGGRGNGKSCTSITLMDYMEKSDVNKELGFYALKFPASLLPKWVIPAETLEDILPNSRILIDDAGRLLDCRRSMGESNISFTQQIQIARHDSQTMIANLPSTDLTDKRIVGMSDVLVLKKPSFLQKEFERPFIKKMFKKYEKHLKNKEHAVILSDTFQGVVKVIPPIWWNENISHAHKKEVIEVKTP